MCMYLQLTGFPQGISNLGQWTEMRVKMGKWGPKNTVEGNPSTLVCNIKSHTTSFKSLYTALYVFFNLLETPRKTASHVTHKDL